VSTALLVARDLAVDSDGHVLLQASSFELHEGERVLLVGPSGSGKSLLLDLLLGFAGSGRDGLTVRGDLALEGRSLVGVPPEAHDGHVGAVFQLHALGLFDDLTLEENLAFGRAAPDEVARVAGRLGLGRRERRVAAASGGERMRVAMARTLLRGGRVFVYDEPTTGLDPAAVGQVVEAIGTAHDRLSLVVTHDPGAFEGWADIVLTIDPVARRIERREASAATFAWLHERLGRPAEAGAAPEAPPAPRGPGAFLRGWDTLARRVGSTTVDVLRLLAVPLALGRLAHPLDGPRLRRTLRRDLAPGVFAFTGLSSALVALTATFFLFERLPKREWTAPLVQDDLVAGLGLVTTRVGVPLMISILLAAKLGAAAAAHLGHMSLTRQVDALRLLDVDPRRHLLLPTAVGQLLAAWIATALGWALSTGAALVVFLAMHPGWSTRWFAEAWVREIPASAIAWAAAKVGVSALGVAVVAYRVGIAPKRRPEQVIHGIHATLLRALLLVVAIHAVFAFVEL
jgi:ABC-type lipoprotein export system ATPase subunit/ABC-type transporter Mla maintaining outer membrane lipid asymmetry permease subunit MlaE